MTLSDTTDENIECFRIATQTATYYYDKTGAGFTSIVDADSNDWIGWREGGGSAGEYRGIPNMGLNKFGHPGYTGAVSTSPDARNETLDKVTIHSAKGDWSTTWEFYENHAKMTVHSVAEDYWFLYEGTPGGEYEDADIWYTSAGDSGICSESFTGDITNTSGAAERAEWICFADASLNRALFMIHTEVPENNDAIVDHYRPMQGNMTVFGFGRNSSGTTRQMSHTPAVLIIGLVEQKEYADVKQHIDSIYQDSGTSCLMRSID
ncbi:MAG: hypothetical protein GF350_05135, partial [Chitinivibrionales bacterium]|nr:hypothetical protein [Chitinivibrionales bacterium]